MQNSKSHSFTSVIQKLSSWYIAPLPDHFEIEAVQAFGRTPVIATLEGKTWSTSLWTEKSGQTMIAIPKKVRGSYGEGDLVEISFEFDYDRFV
jgi:hypothetical protein